MLIRAFGFVSIWDKQFTTDAHQCAADIRSMKLEALSLNGLSGAFIVLLVGYLISLVVLMGERIQFSCAH